MKGFNRNQQRRIRSRLGKWMARVAIASQFSDKKPWKQMLEGFPNFGELKNPKFAGRFAEYLSGTRQKAES